MNHFTNPPTFRTKKAALAADLRTREQWFKKYRVPRTGEQSIEVKGDDYFHEDQTEELYSRSKGQREIGSLIEGSEPVGEKRLPRRSVRYEVFRQSDFVYEPKKVCHRTVTPPHSVDILEAVGKVKSTAGKFETASKAAHKRGDRRRSRGFLKRMNNLLEIVDLGLRRAIVLERVDHVGTRGGVHRYAGEGWEFQTRIKPPSWMERKVRLDKKSNTILKPRCRLKDAVWTIEQFRSDPTLNW